MAERRLEILVLGYVLLGEVRVCGAGVLRCVSAYLFISETPEIMPVIVYRMLCSMVMGRFFAAVRFTVTFDVAFLGFIPLFWVIN